MSYIDHKLSLIYRYVRENKDKIKGNKDLEEDIKERIKQWIFLADIINSDISIADALDKIEDIGFESTIEVLQSSIGKYVNIAKEDNDPPSITPDTSIVLKDFIDVLGCEIVDIKKAP